MRADEADVAAPSRRAGELERKVDISCELRGDRAGSHFAAAAFVTALHRGSFDGLAATYAWLAREFIPREGRTIRKAPALEMYLTQPDRTPPADQLTEVMIPVR